MEELKYKYLILVVIYNTKLSSVSTLNSLNSCKYHNKSKIIIWDNSPQKADNENIAFIETQFNDFEYIHSPQNLSLSTIYNNIINTYIDIKNSQFDYLVLFDQDSTFKGDFFENIDRIISTKKDLMLILPIIKASGYIVSPSKQILFKGSYWKKKKTGRVKSKFSSAINSGMIISTQYLKRVSFRYDESYKFYGTDIYFMKNYTKNEKYFYVMDYEIQHDLSKFNSEEDIHTRLFRHDQNMEAIQKLYCTNLINTFFTKFYIYIYSLKQALIYREIKFIRNF
jgi:GT2 family glycosyltransferase